MHEVKYKPKEVSKLMRTDWFMEYLKKAVSEYNRYIKFKLKK